MDRKELKTMIHDYLPCEKCEYTKKYCSICYIYNELLEDKVISQQETIDLQMTDIDANLEETEGLHKRIKELEDGIQEIKSENQRAYNDFVHAEYSQLDVTKGYHNALVTALKMLGEIKSCGSCKNFKYCGQFSDDDMGMECNGIGYTWGEIK